MTQPNLINLHPNEYSQEFRYQFTVNRDRFAGRSCIIVDDLSSRVYLPNKTEDINWHLFNIIAGVKNNKTLAIYI